MPFCFLKVSSVGWACVLSSTSMYACQFDQLTVLSTSDRSEADGLADAEAPAPPVPLVPQAARAAAAPTAPAPCMRVRRVRRPRRSAGEGVTGRFSVMVGVPPGTGLAMRSGAGRTVGWETGAGRVLVLSPVAEDGAVPVLGCGGGEVVHDVLDLGVLLERVGAHVL